MNVLEDLMWRGLLSQSTDPGALAEALEAEPITFYVGFDPTAPSIHMGNLVQLMLARALQRAGHKPLILVGGATGLIGDPRESGERQLNDTDVVAQWGEAIASQVSKFISFEGSAAARLVNNYEWSAPMGVLEFLRDVGKHFPVNRMLDRELVSRRLAEGGLSYTEFSYVLLQSMDFLELYRRYDCRLQTGGSDQWGNITAGVDLVRRAAGGKVHALATPLLTKEDGTKFGKTETGTVWLSRELMSPYAFYQYFLNVEDSKVVEYLKIFSERPRAEIEEIAQEAAANPHRRTAQRALADDVTRLVHSEADRASAEAAGLAVFGRGDVRSIDAATMGELREQLRGTSLPIEGLTMIDAMVAAGVVESRSAARRAVQEGGAYLNNERVDDADLRITLSHLLCGKFAMLRRGKKNVGIIEVTH